MRAVMVVVLLGFAAPAYADEAWDRYDAAFEALAAGDQAGARATLETIVATSPDHPAAVKARARLAELGVVAVEAPGAVDVPAPTPATTTSRVARAELVLGMTVTGVFAGIEACTDACDQARSQAAGVMIGGGGALGLTLLASRKGIHSGEAQLYNSATTWGRWNALGALDGFPSTTKEAWLSLGAQAAGLGVGVGLWKLWRPSAGDVALANSGLLWGTVLSSWGQLWFGRDPTFPAAVIAGDIGLAIGAALASEVKMSRGRTLLIDVGGVLGSLLGGLVAVGLDSGDADRKIGGVMTISTALGLGLAAVATRRWDEP